jgi:hypothetical protein
MRARSAAERNHLDVARITLQTLVNTYPNSEYAARAERILNDPRMASCGGSEGTRFMESVPPPYESVSGGVNGEQPLLLDSDGTPSEETAR